MMRPYPVNLSLHPGQAETMKDTRKICKISSDDGPSEPVLDVRVLPDGDYSVGMTPPGQPRHAVRLMVRGSRQSPAVLKAVRDLYEAGTDQQEDVTLADALLLIEHAQNVISELIGPDMPHLLRRPVPEVRDDADKVLRTLTYLASVLQSKKVHPYIKRQMQEADP